MIGERIIREKHPAIGQTPHNCHNAILVSELRFPGLNGNVFSIANEARRIV